MADPSEFQFIVTICTVSKFFVVSNLLWKKIKIQKFLKVTFSFKKWQQNEDLGRKYLSSSSHDHQMILKSFFLLGSDTQQFLRAFIAEIEPATFGNHRTEEWHFDCAQLGGIRRYFTFKILTRFSTLEMNPLQYNDLSILPQCAEKDIESRAELKFAIHHHFEQWLLIIDPSGSQPVSLDFNSPLFLIEFWVDSFKRQIWPW